MLWGARTSQLHVCGGTTAAWHISPAHRIPPSNAQNQTAASVKDIISNRCLYLTKNPRKLHEGYEADLSQQRARRAKHAPLRPQATLPGQQWAAAAGSPAPAAACLRTGWAPLLAVHMRPQAVCQRPWLLRWRASRGRASLRLAGCLAGYGALVQGSHEGRGLAPWQAGARCEPPRSQQRAWTLVRLEHSPSATQPCSITCSCSSSCSGIPAFNVRLRAMHRLESAQAAWCGTAASGGSTMVVMQVMAQQMPAMRGAAHHPGQREAWQLQQRR